MLKVLQYHVDNIFLKPTRKVQEVVYLDKRSEINLINTLLSLISMLT